MDGDPFGLLGNVLDGKFRVDAVVGDGELTVVYKGYDLGRQAPVAIKCLHLPDTLDQTLTRPVVEAFDDAGRLYTRFGRDNTHIPKVIAAGRTIAPRTGTMVPYRVREWLEGESLASELARRRRQGDKLRTVQEAFALFAPAIDGIAQAHEEGLVHLSLSPANLFLARGEGQGSLRVLDFGITRASHHADGRPTLDSEVTRGLHLLHPAYAAPEQLDMDVGEPGPWTDVYALALIFMEVLADRSDVERRDTPALVSRALDKLKRPTPQAHGLKLPGTLDRVLTRAVARSPQTRPQNARVFLNELRAAMGLGEPAKAAPRQAPPLPSSVARAEVERPPWVPTAAASGPVVSATGSLDPGLVDLEQQVVRRLSSSRTLRLRVGAAALAFAGIVAGLLVLAHPRRPPATLAAGPPPTALSAMTTVSRPAVAPVEPIAAAPGAALAVAAVAPAVAPPPAAPAVVPDVRATSAHSATGPIVRFSWADAQRAVHSVKRRLSQCRHGRFWGSGYATVEFSNDGRVQRVLVDPPYSMTVTGKCVADALGSTHVGSFVGHDGYYRFRFYIAPR
jgi:serine/threonine protein kinase